jgi:hypothetical protein
VSRRIALLAVLGLAASCALSGSARAAPSPSAVHAALALRARIAAAVWRDGRLPTLRPQQSGTTLTIPLRDGFASVAHLLVPAVPNGRAVIWHVGHEAEENELPVAQQIAAAGYLVVVMNMPLVGPSIGPPWAQTLLAHWWDGSGPAYVGPCGGVAAYFRHEIFSCFSYPLAFFLTPVVAVGNWLTGHGYRRIAMAGLSGGGWTTFMAAALDTRIKLAFPVAGSRPGHGAVCRTTSLCGLDYEQRYVFRLVPDYQPIYLLGAWGKGRSLTAIYNSNDPCCFGGTDTSWVPPLQRQLHRLGAGHYEVLITRNDQHSVDDQALGWILARLAADGRRYGGR